MTISKSFIYQTESPTRKNQHVCFYSLTQNNVSSLHTQKVETIIGEETSDNGAKKQAIGKDLFSNKLKIPFYFYNLNQNNVSSLHTKNRNCYWRGGGGKC